MSCSRFALVSTMAMLVNLSVAGCDKIHPSVQYEKGTNASTTFTHALLTVPPEFSLRPTASEIGDNHDATHDTRGTGVNAVDYSVGTAVLLQAIGTTRILQSIRSLVDHEAYTSAEPEFIDQIVSLRAQDLQLEQTTVLDGEPTILPIALSVPPPSIANPDANLPREEALQPVPPLPRPTISRKEKMGWVGLF